MSTEKTVDFSTMLASTAHDMKNSLSLIINTLDEVSDGIEQNNQDNTLSDPINHLRYEAKRLNSHLVQLLTFYKLEKQQYNLYLDLHSVFEFIEDQMLSFQSTTELKKINTTMECSEDLEWMFDEDLISGVINNVINNSLRYTKSRIHLHAAEEDDYLKITIEDDGDGYPQSMLDYDPDAPTDINFVSSSTGLGLYFSSVIAKAHGTGEKHGHIKLANGGSLGGGCFSIYIPR